MAGAKKEKKHIVVFQDEEGNVLKTSFVSHEEEAIPPELPEKKGESEHHEIKFQGWDQDISCVQGNLVVKAVYKEVPKEYLVMYFHESGKLLGTESVPYGQAASQPYHPQKPKTAEHYYIFKGWNNDLSHIEKDTMAKAVFEERKRSFTVAFFHEDGTVLKKEEVLYGQEAHAPQSPVKQQDAVWHYIFEGWDKTFDSVKENIEVHAVFSSVYNEYNVCIYERLSESNNGLQDEQLEEKIKAADYVFTGEGGMDFQTKFGKAPYGVSRLAKKYQKPVFACAGYIGKDVDVLYEEGMTAIFGILAKAEPLEAALKNGPVNLERTVENIARTLQLVPCD